jgi:hypothetical protein
MPRTRKKQINVKEILQPIDDLSFFIVVESKFVESKPYESKFVEKVVLSLKVDLSSSELTMVKWFAFKRIYLTQDENGGSNNWRDPQYTECDRESITDLILYVKTAHREKNPVPQWYRDYHELGVTEVKSLYDSSRDELDSA